MSFLHTSYFYIFAGVAKIWILVQMEMTLRVHLRLCNTHRGERAKGVKGRYRARETEEEDILTRGLLVKEKATWVIDGLKGFFLFLSIESDRACSDPSPPTAPLHRPGEGRALYWWLDFDLDLQDLQLIPTHPQSTTAQKIRLFSFLENQQDKANWRDRWNTLHTPWRADKNTSLSLPQARVNRNLWLNNFVWKI